MTWEALTDAIGSVPSEVLEGHALRSVEGLLDELERREAAGVVVADDLSGAVGWLARLAAFGFVAAGPSWGLT